MLQSCFTHLNWLSHVNIYPYGSSIKIESTLSAELQVMVEMENAYYQMQSEFPVALDVASMILVFKYRYVSSSHFLCPEFPFLGKH